MSAASQARLLLLVCTARSTRLAEAVPAVCAGTVVALPLAVLATMKPALLKVLAQLLATAQLLPLGQHWRALVAAVDSPDSVTETAGLLGAAGKLSVVVATPLALKVTLVAPKLAPLVAKVAVAPLTVVAALVQGLELLAQAVTVTVVGRQVRLLVGSDSS